MYHIHSPKGDSMCCPVTTQLSWFLAIFLNKSQRVRIFIIYKNDIKTVYKTSFESIDLFYSIHYINLLILKNKTTKSTLLSTHLPLGMAGLQKIVDHWIYLSVILLSSPHKLLEPSLSHYDHCRGPVLSVQPCISWKETLELFCSVSALHDLSRDNCTLSDHNDLTRLSFRTQAHFLGILNQRD